MEFAVPAFRPYPFTLVFRGETPLRFHLRGRGARRHLWVDAGGVRFGRSKGVPAPFLSRVDELYAPSVLSLFHLELPGGFLGEAFRQGVELEWGDGVFRQGNRGERYLHLDPHAPALTLWEAQGGTLRREAFPHLEALALRVRGLVEERGPLRTTLPRGPLPQALRTGDVEGLRALRDFSHLLAQGYAQALATFPEAAPFLPRFLPDGRRVRAGRERPTALLVEGGEVVPLAPQEPPEDPLLAFRAYWDEVPWSSPPAGWTSWRWPPSPSLLPEGTLLFTPSLGPPGKGEGLAFREAKRGRHPRRPLSIPI